MGANVLTCWYCGCEMISESEKASLRPFHTECQIKFEKDQDELRTKYVKLKSEVMFQRALREMERQDEVFMSNYYDEAQLVHEMSQNNPFKFQSSDEMMAAIELVRKRVHTKAQFKIRKRRVDFLLPDLKVALEIDGALHRFKIGKDSEREIEIMNNLKKDFGGNWEVIRIPTDLIEKNLTRLVPAIKALYNKRQKLRKENGGFLPSYWSRTNKMSQISALKGTKDATLKTLDTYQEDNPKEL
ncbi:hypothetical protein [Liquorilactobacillus sp.]|uniref:hypothetical protein n=1 Tax=Liquorilactobacillus sp. TaxID=2767923 RepID=UPI0039EC4472